MRWLPCITKAQLRACIRKLDAGLAHSRGEYGAPRKRSIVIVTVFVDSMNRTDSFGFTFRKRGCYSSFSGNDVVNLTFAKDEIFSLGNSVKL